LKERAEYNALLLQSALFENGSGLGSKSPTFGYLRNSRKIPTQSSQVLVTIPLDVLN
jgi:hypothetical protein